jgi:hypothetical protein
MASSVSNFTSNATPVPTCDAWGNIKAGTSTTGQSTSIMDSSGVSSVVRLSTGLHGITFSNPERFGGGGYVTLYTPEWDHTSSSLITPVLLNSRRDMAGSGGATAAGKTAGVQLSTWGFDAPVGAGGNTARQQDFTWQNVYMNFAAFSLSTDSELRVPAGGTYALVPGAKGFGVTGATYTSALTNLLSKRTATAYGTIVIPPNKGNSSTVSAYIENGFNVKGVSAGGNSLFDVSFVKPMTNANYCVILSGEYEPVSTGTISADNTSILEYSLLMVHRGINSDLKTTNGFRAVSLKQNSVDNSWYQSSVIYQSGLTERIHFMVFGGATYGQP